MIEVKNLTKRYGKNLAVDDLNFTVQDNEIYGFLGPNGAGKSTTMNIMTGYLSTDEGEVLINGHSIFDEPEEAKALIGYLPEQPPLYVDMTPYEYLMFVAELKKIAKEERKDAIEKAMEKTGVTEVKNRLIKNLSKGYRQRVGFAEAILGEPPVIILDEPMVGLDPKQIIEIRQLIRDLGKSHTVILSSHILSEISEVADTVMIISKGKLVALDSTQNLEEKLLKTNTYNIEVRCSLEKAREVIEKISGLTISEQKEIDAQNSKLVLTTESTEDFRDKLFFAFADAKVAITTIEKKAASLEEVFIELTDSGQDEPKESEEDDD